MTVEVCQTCDIDGCHHIRDRAARPNLTFAPQAYPNGRILLMLGQHQIGAVFPPAVASDKTDRHPWVWRFWLTTTARDGRSKSEHGAKNDLIGVAKTWLQQAGVQG